MKRGKQWSAALVLTGLFALSTPVAMVPATAQGVDPILEESLSALDALVTKDGGHCTLRDALDAETESDTKIPYVLCDDGLPPSGGGSNGIPVPIAYHSSASGDDYSRLPRPATPEEAAEKTALYDLRGPEPADAADRVTLDVDITLPASRGIAKEYGQPWPAPREAANGRPVIALMHGCCAGNKASWEAATLDGVNQTWHQSNAWFATRGYVVLNYTARGFRNSNNEGSTGSTQLNSRRFEINDFQYLVGLMVDHDAKRRAEGKAPIFNVDPSKIGAVGGSYGGGWAWLALTDPRWRSPIEKTPIKLATAVPRYGWTDLLEALVPSGHYRDRDFETGKSVNAPTSAAEAVSRKPLGVPKESIVDLLYAQGNNASSNHTTFPIWMREAYNRLKAGGPYDGDPLIEQVAEWFVQDRSAYFQQRFWAGVARGLRVPIFVAATWTDPLFTSMDSGVRVYNKLRSIAPKYPVQMYLGDYEHFAANKPKEWGDLCGDDHHVCTSEDFKRADGTYNFSKAESRVRVGVNTRMNRFLDHYLLGKGTQPVPAVWSTTQICASNASEGFPADEPGIEYSAKTWRALAPVTTRFAWKGGGAATTTTSNTAADNHAQESDPGYRQFQTDKCYTTTASEATPFVVQYVQEVPETFTLLGLPAVKLTYTEVTDATSYWIAGRLFDRSPDGRMTMVTRGMCRVNEAVAPDEKCEIFDLWGNSWTFEKGHTLVLEISQADTRTFRLDAAPSSLSFEAAEIKLPTTTESLRRDFRD